jgi:hypothetical protein
MTTFFLLGYAHGLVFNVLVSMLKTSFLLHLRSTKMFALGKFTQGILIFPFKVITQPLECCIIRRSTEAGVGLVTRGLGLVI